MSTLTVAIFEKGLQLGIASDVVYSIVLYASQLKPPLTIDIEMTMCICNRYAHLFKKAAIQKEGLYEMHEKRKAHALVIEQLKCELSDVKTAAGIYYSNNVHTCAKGIDLLKREAKNDNDLAQFYLGKLYINHEQYYTEGTALINAAMASCEDIDALSYKCNVYIHRMLSEVTPTNTIDDIFTTHITNAYIRLSLAHSEETILTSDLKDMVFKAGKEAMRMVNKAVGRFNHEFVFDTSIVYDDHTFESIFF